MQKREISGCNFNVGISSLIYDGNLDDETHPPHSQSKQDRQQVPTYSTTPWRRCRPAAVSLILLAAVLLIVDISLWVHSTNLPRNDTEDISKELAKLQVIYKAAVGAMEGAKKQLDSEMSRQKPTNWELEHQTKRSKDYEVQLVKINMDIAKLRYNLPMINAGCTHCTPGWILMNSVCYYFSENIRKPWQKAREYCQVHGGDLLVLDSKDKENATVKFLLDNTQTDNGFWIGLRDFPKESTWKWVDGRALVEGYWNDGEPNNNSEDHCGIVKVKENFFKAWNNVNCENYQRWICEKPPIFMS